MDSESLFPLPLTPFETLMVLDDRPEWPMTFCVECVFRGRFDRPKFEAALQQALRRHPLLIARIQRSGGRWLWQASEARELPLSWSEFDSEPPPTILPRIDLRREPGLRIEIAAGPAPCNGQPTSSGARELASSESASVSGAIGPPAVDGDADDGDAREPEAGFRSGAADGRSAPVAIDANVQTRLRILLHHACCDGLGARRFAQDLWILYAREVHGAERAPRLDRLDARLLLDRATWSTPAGEPAAAGTSLWDKLRHAYDFHVRGPMPMARGPARGESPARSPPPEPISSLVRQCVFSRDATRAINERAREAGLTMNDIATSLFLQTVAEWNAARGARPHQRIRLLIPTDLRRREHDRSPATNRMSYAFVSRSLGACQHWGNLTESVHREMEYVRQVQLGLDFLNIVGGLGKLPGALPLFLRVPRCLATAILTNLGDPTRRFRRRFPSWNGCPVIGDVALEQILGTPPLRPKTDAGVGLCVCSGQLTVSLQMHARRFTPDDAARMLDSYIAGWHAWLARMVR